MPALPSIYDLTIEPLRAWDFSRPLFVQASRAPEFDELVDVLHVRLGLAPERSTILTNAAYPPRASWRGQHLRNPEPRLSDGTAAFVADLVRDPFSVLVTTTTAHNLAMRFHSNVACFCHAMEPTPSLVVNRDGQFATARDFFLIADHVVGTATFVANILGSQMEAEALFEAARKRPRGQVVEIGRFSGGTAVLLALAARQSGQPGVISIDMLRLPAAEYFCRVNGVEADVQLLDGASHEIAACWRDRQPVPDISLLFIDADHSYEAVARDIAAWVPYVVDGGTIALHDSCTADCGVAKAVYYHLRGRDGFGNFRQVGSMVLSERESRP
jgi:predicted O-methyltransferase YrrM